MRGTEAPGARAAAPPVAQANTNLDLDCGRGGDASAAGRFGGMGSGVVACGGADADAISHDHTHSHVDANTDTNDHVNGHTHGHTGRCHSN